MNAPKEQSSFAQALTTLAAAPSMLRDATKSGNLKVLKSLLGPAYRGMFDKRGHDPFTTMPVRYGAHFDWGYLRDRPQLARLYEAAKSSQWNASTDLDWSIDVDPADSERALLPYEFSPVWELDAFQKLSPKEKAEHRRDFLGWFLSQFLHGEQGALFAACQVTEAVPWLDGKLYGSTQVVDEGRHVEVFHRYLTTKLERKYEINDNLYVVIDALMSDSRWDLKFLGMQIMIEGLALGAFGMIQQKTKEPLLKTAAQVRDHRRGAARALRGAGAAGGRPAPLGGRAARARGLVLRGLAVPAQPLLRLRDLRSALGPRDDARRVGGAGARALR